MKLAPITQKFIQSAATATRKKRGKGQGWRALLGELKGMKLKRPGSSEPAFKAEYSGPPITIREKKIKQSGNMPTWLIPVIGAAALAFIVLKKRKK